MAIEEEYTNSAIANVVTSWLMPDLGVSERTQSAYATGALRILEHLISGVWECNVPKSLVGEFLGRVLANARQQGFEVGDAYVTSFELVEPIDRSFGPADPVEMVVAQAIYGFDGPCGTEDVLDHLHEAQRAINGLIEAGYKIQKPSIQIS